jgi:acyl-CoA dehydrogenase
MTEPPPGAGSDPTALRTTAKADAGGGFIINGEKWLITGADGAAFTIIMARTFDQSGTDLGASMFLAPMPDARIVTERTLDTMDSSFTGGHAHLRFDNLRVGGDAVLGQVGQGFKYAQVSAIDLLRPDWRISKVSSAQASHEDWAAPA